MVCWMDETAPLRRRAQVRDQAHDAHGAGGGQGGLHYRLDVNTLHRDETATELALNEIGRVRLRTTAAAVRPTKYRRNRTTGGFILIDEATNRTVAAGMIGRLPG